MSTQDINRIMGELAEYQRLNDELKAHIESLKDDLKRFMIENGLTELNGLEHKATYKTVTSSRLDTKALKKDHEDIVIQYTKTSVSNRFVFQ